ncbi:sulfite exporter TauE/SafE family protein [Roseiconus nitratireducens]|uniref:Probable membrane transporter protein n=1 Tax=Roseiconus nitratireducens TaxID=2605748 RepID=A0A5M6DET7_9BACT|nr:sulfite exporter TauE/SafE family protein [Roseiconus nitratireducens]KAA5545903.1 sulfite exporter TauE/SafE family protein [Roseiconus nitratireducens]
MITPDGYLLLVAVGVIALVAGFIHSAVGFGFGIVAVTLLPWVIDVEQTHVVTSTASVPVLMMATWAYRRGADFQSLRQALIAAAICLPLGLFAFERMPNDLLVRATGIAVLAMVFQSFRNRRYSAGSSSKTGSAWLAGGFAGFLAGAVSIAGPPIAAFALQQHWPQVRFKAFVNQFLLAVSIYKVLGLSVRGFIDSTVLYQVALIAPLAIIGIQLGARESQNLSAQSYQRFVAAALILLACYFLLRGAG